MGGWEEWSVSGGSPPYRRDLVVNREIVVVVVVLGWRLHIHARCVGDEELSVGASVGGCYVRWQGTTAVMGGVAAVGRRSEGGIKGQPHGDE